MSAAIHGACLCGGVEFDIESEAMGICHCSRCQRWTGSSGLAFVVVEPDSLRFTKGQELVGKFAQEGFSTRNFCTQCGSSLYDDASTVYYVGAGVLQNPKLEPTFHIHVASKAPWDEIAGDATQHAAMPA